MYKFRKEMTKRYPFTAEIQFPPKKKFFHQRLSSRLDNMMHFKTSY